MSLKSKTTYFRCRENAHYGPLSNSKLKGEMASNLADASPETGIRENSFA